MKKILITGYEPFGGDDYNPSLDAARRLEGETYKGHVFVCEPVPVNRFECIKKIKEALEKHDPHIVLALGLAWNREGISVERVAINVADFPIPDNAGYQAMGEIIDENGQNAYFAHLPIRTIVSRLRAAGIPARISNTAGTFCCNIVMYTILKWIEEKNDGRKGGFLHIPFETRQAAEKHEQVPFMDIESVVKAVRVAAQTAVDNEEDTAHLISGEVS